MAHNDDCRGRLPSRAMRYWSGRDALTLARGRSSSVRARRDVLKRADPSDCLARTAAHRRSHATTDPQLLSHERRLRHDWCVSSRRRRLMYDVFAARPAIHLRESTVIYSPSDIAIARVSRPPGERQIDTACTRYCARTLFENSVTTIYASWRCRWCSVAHGIPDREQRVSPGCSKDQDPVPGRAHLGSSRTSTIRPGVRCEGESVTFGKRYNLPGRKPSRRGYVDVFVGCRWTPTRCSSSSIMVDVGCANEIARAPCKLDRDPPSAPAARRRATRARSISCDDRAEAGAAMHRWTQRGFRYR